MSDIVKYSNGLAINTLDEMKSIATILAQSGFFSDAKGAAQAFTKILAGKELGFNTFASMTGIHLINGRPSIGANLIAAAIKSHPKYDYRVKTMTNELCEIEFLEVIDGKRESIGVSSFSLVDAKKAGTKNTEKFARNMLFARAISNGVRWYTPDVFFGAPVYTPEELGATVDDNGKVESIEVEVIEPPVVPSSDPLPECKTPGQMIEWAIAKLEGMMEPDEVNDLLANTPVDENGKKKANFYNAVMAVIEENI